MGVTFWTGRKTKTVTVAGDNFLNWVLGGSEPVIGYVANNGTTNPCAIGLRISDNPAFDAAPLVHHELAVSDKGLAPLFPRPLKSRYIQIWFEDCVVGDVIYGRLIFE